MKHQPKKGPTLMEYVERYILARDLSPEYADKIRCSNRRFGEWLGRQVCIGELDCDTGNKWLADLQAAGTNPRTIHGHRAALLAVWREAYLNGDNDQPPLRVKKIKRPRITVLAYSHTEVRKLLTAAAALTKFYPNGVRACDFWLAAIYAAYSTGLRRGDLLAVKREQIREDGTAIVVQRKTGYPVCVRFADESLVLIRSFNVGEWALPWPFKSMQFTRQFIALRKWAGVERGTFKWIRRTAGSYSERDRHGDGSKLLGHRCESVFRNHYEDTGITSTEAVQPPKIA